MKLITLICSLCLWLVVASNGANSEERMIGYIMPLTGDAAGSSKEGLIFANVDLPKDRPEARALRERYPLALLVLRG